MRKNKVTRRDVLFLSISFFVIVVIWIAMSVYHAIVTSTVSEDLQKKIIPIASKFDTSIITKLKTRQQVNPFEDANQASASSSENQLSITPEPFPSEEVTLTPEPTTTIQQPTQPNQPAP